MTASISPEFLALQELLAGRYSIERELGRGGMGIVLLARDVALDRPVAIKLLPPHLATRPDERERFLEEARTAAGLAHPNIVPIHLVEARGELVLFVMGFVDGETLRDRVERAGPLSPRLALKLLQEVAWALGYAHQRGVIHRDVKPDNIMIERATDRALVTDFGIALGRREAESAGGPIVGTARYMSPEQACGEPVDARSDLYSLGATFFYALTGRAPFEGTNLPAILTKQVYETAPLVQALRPEVPAKLAAVVDRLLRKAPAERFQTADDLARVVGEVRGRDFRAPHLGGKSRTLVLQARRVRPQGDRTPGPALGRADGARAGTLGALGLQGAAGAGAARGTRSPRRGRATRDRGGGTAGQGRHRRIAHPSRGRARTPAPRPRQTAIGRAGLRSHARARARQGDRGPRRAPACGGG